MVINSDDKSHLCVNEPDLDNWAYFQTADFTFSAVLVAKRREEKK